MARKTVTNMSGWPSLTPEGNLIAPAMVASIDRRQALEQKEEDYWIRKGLTIREEVSTAFRVGQSHFDAFARLENPSVEATRRFVRSFAPNDGGRAAGHSADRSGHFFATDCWTIGGDAVLSPGFPMRRSCVPRTSSLGASAKATPSGSTCTTASCCRPCGTPRSTACS